MLVGVAIKWTAGRPEVDTSGSILTDDRFGGVSLADQAALEVALAIGDQVKVVCVGPEAAVGALRDSLAVGATAVQFVACGAQPSSHDVAGLLAQHLDGQRNHGDRCALLSHFQGESHDGLLRNFEDLQL